MRKHAIARHDVGDDVLAEIMRGMRIIGVAGQLLVKKIGVEHVNAHARQRHIGVARGRLRMLGLFMEGDHALLIVHRHHAEFPGILDRHIDAGHRHVGRIGGMKRQHFAVIHLVNVVARQDQDIGRIVVAQDVHVLEHRIGGTAVPHGFVDALLRRHQLDELVELAAQETPAAMQMLQQAVRFVLGDDADAADTGIDAVGKGEIDDAELAGERHGRLGTPVGQTLQATATPASQNHGKGVTRQLTNIARIAMELDAAVHRLLGCHCCFPLWLSCPMVAAVPVCVFLPPWAVQFDRR